MTLLLVALGAAVGAPLRFVTAEALDRPSWPGGTLAVNLVGSFLLGLFTAWGLGDYATALLGTGFCGGFTTYSSFAVQTHRLGPARGTGYAALSLGGGLALAALGFVVGA